MLGDDDVDLVGFVWRIAVGMYSGTIGCLSLSVLVARYRGWFGITLRGLL